MKYLFLTALAATLLSCADNKKKDEPLYPDSQNTESAAVSGQDLFDNVGNCASCHQPDKKVIGPSIQEIADIYKVNGGDMVSFLRGKAEPIVDPTQYEVMKTNFAITKRMSDAELKAIEAYMYSFATKK